MLERDDSDDFGRTLVDELLTSVDSIIFDKHIQQQLIPHTLRTTFDQVLDVVDVCTDLHVVNLYRHFVSI